MALLPCSCEFVGPAERERELLYVGCRKCIFARLFYQSPCLFIVVDGVVQRENGHCSITCCYTPAERWFYQSCRYSMVSQFRWKGSRLSQSMKRASVKDTASRLASLDVDHLANHVVSEGIRFIGRSPASLPRLAHQATLHYLIKSSKPLFFGNICYQAKSFKGRILLQNSASDQKSKGSRAESIDLQANEFANTWREEARYAEFLKHHSRNVVGLCVVFTLDETAAFKQQLEGFDQKERLPARFSREPLSNTF